MSFLAALAIAALVTLLIEREYTATARIIIDPPAAADPRAATAVSSVYLESLKTYEQFAAGDSLFLKAANRFQLQAQSFESLKRHVLRVGILRNTRIMEIAVTLPDPHKAQALAQYVAEQTISTNRTLANQGADDLIAGIEKQAQDARARLNQDDAALLVAEPFGGLDSAIKEESDLRAKLEEQVAYARLQVADPGDRREQTGARARLAELERQIESLNRQIEQKEKVRASRVVRREELENKRKVDEGALSTIEARLRDTRNDLPYRGERLTIIDPGVVPERPSSPNIPLNLLAAALLGLVLPGIYLALAFNLRQPRTASRDVIDDLARKSY